MRIREIIRRQGRTQKDVAEALGWHASFMSRVVSSPRFHLDDLTALAGELGCKVSDFLEQRDEREDAIIDYYRSLDPEGRRVFEALLEQSAAKSDQ